MKKKRKTASDIVKTVRYVAQDGRCFYCHKELLFTEGVCDHAVPAVRGGSRKADNIVFCCPKCDKEKGRMTAAEYINYRLTTCIKERAA